MSEKAPSQEKSPFSKFFHSEWMKKTREKVKNSRSFPLVAGIAAAGLGTAALMALGLATPFAIALGSGAAITAGIRGMPKKEKPKKEAPKKKEEPPKKEKEESKK